MRRVKEILESKGIKDLEDMGWEEARKTAAGEDAAQEWDEGEAERRAQELATKLHRVFGKANFSKIEIFARALELYSPLLVQGLGEYWNEQEESEAQEG